MAANGTSFSYTEEAFLLKCLHEVVLVWKRGTGQANFSFTVKDGKYDIQLGFQLGQPGDPHLQPPAQTKRRFKSVKQRQRDRERAAAYQARQASSADKSSTDDPPTPADSEAVSAENSLAASPAAPPLITAAQPAPPLLQPAVTADHLPPQQPAVPAEPLPTEQPAVPAEPLPPQPAVLADCPPQPQSVQAIAVFESCPNDQLCQDDVESLRKFLLSENHLRSNIVNISLGQVSTRSFRTSFTHTLAVTLEVATSRLWEPAQSYISKHLGKSEWKRSNGTLIKLARIQLL